MKDAGLIKGDIDGVKVCYGIDESEWQKAKAYLNQIFEFYKGNTCC
jgi:hypothetical protein